MEDKKIINYLHIIILVIGIILFSSNYIRVKADSGWDSDYDSSSSSSSSWDSDYDSSSSSSSSWDSDYDSGSSNSSYGGGYSGSRKYYRNGEFFLIILGVLIFGFIIPYIVLWKLIKLFSKHVNFNLANTKDYGKKYVQISNDKANEVIPNFNIEEFNFQAYKIFFDVQMAWMNFDYDKLKELLTDELYNTYLMDLEALKVKNQKNTMKEFEMLHVTLTDLKEENNMYIAKVVLNVKFYDYIESIGTGKILRGTNSKKLNNTYILTFIKSKDEKKIDICPRCGAKTDGNATSVCEYCNSKLINNTHDWVMSKKEKVKQR